MGKCKSVSEVYIKEIVNNLKKHHAAVLVGAGFSRNATRLDGSEKHMPNWNELADIFCEKLGINKTENQYVDPLSLAEQVEVLFGKAYLNNLLKTVMEDEAYQPGKVHDLLMALPWTDVFTTNYDTLLERAFQNSTGRMSYKLVFNHSDLLYSAGLSRIVKLHGSFPSYEPFIISEEDFRRYPFDHAPFVNTVQQSLLENIFVLIGFSGNDPNFQKWIGWIHDNLGLKNSPKIYMISHKPETAVKMRMLEAKNIDVLVLDEIEKYRNNDYKTALELFLNDLKQNIDTKSNSGKLWPEYNGSIRESITEQVYSTLKTIHETYPGWITARYWALTSSSWILNDVEFLIRKLAHKDKKDSKELELCNEFCWLSEITGTIGNVTFSYTIDALKKILLRNSDKKEEQLFLNIELFILRYYRFTGDEQWQDLYSSLAKRIKRTEQWNEAYAKICYENAMRRLYSFQWEMMEDAVHLIPADDEHGEWILKKVGLLALLGCHDEALQLLADGIIYVRRILLRINKEEAVVYNRFTSLESCMIVLHDYIKQAYEFSVEAGTYKHNGDNTNLRGDADIKTNNNGISKNDKDNLINWEPEESDYRTSFIWNFEQEKFAGQLSDGFKPRPSYEVIPTFDIGRITHTTHYGSDNEGLLAAMQYIVFREATGVPFRLNFMVNKEGLIGGIIRLNWFNCRLSAALAIAAGDSKAVESVFTRKAIATIPVKEIDRLCNELIQLLRYAMRFRKSRNETIVIKYVLQDYAFFVVPEAISRLATKCSESVLISLIDLLSEIYHYSGSTLFENVNHLLQRTIDLMPFITLEKVLHKFWRFDIKPCNHYYNLKFVDPFYYIHERVLKANKELTFVMDKEEKMLFEGWLKKTSDPVYRNSVLKRLTYIYRIYNLPNHLRNEFKKVLWAKNNLTTYGLPNLGEFFSVCGTMFPHDGNDEELLSAAERYVIDQYKDIINSNYIKDISNLIHMTYWLIENTDIGERKAGIICKIASDFAVKMVGHLKQTMDFGNFNVNFNLEQLDLILGYVLLKSGMADSSKSANNRSAKKVLKLLAEHNIPHALLSWCLSKNDRYGEILAAMLRAENKFLHNANQAVWYLSEQGIVVDGKWCSLLVDSLITAKTYDVNQFASGLLYLIKKDLLEKEQCQLIADSLLKFDAITVLDDKDDNDSVMNKLAMRQIASDLAHTLFNWFERKCIPIPKGIAHWKAIATDSEEFAEIRLVWE